MAAMLPLFDAAICQEAQKHSYGMRINGAYEKWVDHGGLCCIFAVLEMWCIFTFPKEIDSVLELFLYS